MNLKEIAEKYLKENGYDGLVSDWDDCGCIIGDLMPCDEPGARCGPGYKVPCPGPEECNADGDCPWHICKNKPEPIPQEG